MYVSRTGRNGKPGGWLLGGTTLVGTAGGDVMRSAGDEVDGAVARVTERWARSTILRRARGRPGAPVRDLQEGAVEGQWTTSQH
jgi:hypothetical protein